MRNFFMLFFVAMMAFGVRVQAVEVLEVLESVEIEVPVIMYHLVTEQSKYIGKYGIRPDDFETDLVYLRDNGYTPIVMEDLFNFVNNMGQLPEKPIMLTFDDGNSGDYEYVLPLLQKYNMRAIVAIIGATADQYTPLAEENPKAKYPNLTWGQVLALHESGLVEIQNHSYDLHGKNGSGRRKGESDEAYHIRLREDLKKLQDACSENIGHIPTAFIYPLGVIGEGSQKVLEELGMVASFGCEEGMNLFSRGDLDGLFRIKRVNRANKRTVEEILGKLPKKNP
ncbi:MAG: polysaccharide deacetylase family protein [Defluviitaleaceae bacterium]|nr:polysaccharide deacetylase family protein [Defluviitaleaceae bacterium]